MEKLVWREKTRGPGILIDRYTDFDLITIGEKGWEEEATTVRVP